MMGKMTKDFMRIAIVLYLVYAFVAMDLVWVSKTTGFIRGAYAFMVILIFMAAYKEQKK